MDSTLADAAPARGRASAGPLLPRLGRALGAGLKRMPLQRRFALVGGIVTLAGMAATGLWVSREIVHSVTRNSAISTALYMESFIAPLSQELAHGDALSPATEARLRGHLSAPPVSDRIAAAKIWGRDGLVVFSTDPDLTGRRFDVSDSLRRAWGGRTHGLLRRAVRRRGRGRARPAHSAARGLQPHPLDRDRRDHRRGRVLPERRGA